MDPERMREMETLCTQEQPPACSAACPLHVDAGGMSAAIAKGDFDAALAIYQKAILFPAIISHVCDSPCECVCKRGEIGGSIRIRDLEKASVTLGKDKPKRSFLPSREGRVAVIGGGLSGLTAAIELGRKGYGVTILEAEGRLGGRLWSYSEEELPRVYLETDLKRLEGLSIKIRLNEHIGGQAEIERLKEDFDAIYLAVSEGASFDHGPINDVSLLTVISGVFIGRRRAVYSPIASMADGRRAAISIDRFLQGVSLTSAREREGAFETTLYTNIEGIIPQEPVKAACGSYTAQEAIEEGKRCIQCECMECVKGCAFLAHYKSYPKRYVHETYNNLTIVMGTRHANGMINACSLCGQCGEICPNGLNMAEIFAAARCKMVETGKMPPSAQDFALRDLAFSNSDAFFLARHQPGFNQSRYVFFPGCQLGASSPKVVRAAYEDLAARLSGGAGLMLGCCGVIADWAGQTEVFTKAIEKLSSAWESLGSPEVIAGCPTCYMVLSKAIPGMSIKGIWDILEDLGLPERHAMGMGKTLAVQDACTTRFEGSIQNSIRGLAQGMGFSIEELPYGREKTQCCGYGGLTSYANKDVANEMGEHWAVQSKADYLAYCANCRDSVLKTGKSSFHLLDLAYPDSALQGEVPGYSTRRENREKLKAEFLREVWEENILDPEYEVAIKLEDGLQKTMEERMILREDVVSTIAEAEKSGGYLEDAAKGIRVASLKRGGVTYWVWYTQEEDSFRVSNAYSHRMDIEV